MAADNPFRRLIRIPIGFSRQWRLQEMQLSTMKVGWIVAAMRFLNTHIDFGQLHNT